MTNPIPRESCFEFQNSNLESTSQLNKSVEWLSLNTNVNNQIPLTHHSDKLPKPSQCVEFQSQNENERNKCHIISENWQGNW